MSSITTLKRVAHRKETYVLSLKLYSEHIEFARQLVSEGLFFSIAEVIRHVIRLFIDAGQPELKLGICYPFGTSGPRIRGCSIKFPRGMLAGIDRAVKVACINRSDFVRRAFDWYIDKLERDEQ